MKTQIKSARVLVGLTQAELCKLASIPLITLRRVEGKPDHAGLVSADAVEAIRKALEARGIQFLDNGDVATGPGVAVKGAQQ